MKVYLKDIKDNDKNIRKPRKKSSNKNNNEKILLVQYIHYK